MSRQIHIGHLTLGGGAILSPEVRSAYMRGEIAQIKQ